LEVLHVTGPDIQREVIAALPEILDESTVESEVVPSLQELMTAAPSLTIVILDTLTNFKFGGFSPCPICSSSASLQPSTLASFQIKVLLCHILSSLDSQGHG
jgi:hypothetical protein